jgi:hypothetical protein
LKLNIKHINQKENFDNGGQIRLIKILLLFLLGVILVILAYFLKQLDTSLFRTAFYTPPALPDNLMETMKTKGCVADGLLTGFGEDINAKAVLLSDSECLYLHRAIETWNIPPDFDSISAGMKTVRRASGKNYIWGMFLAEAINIKSSYYFANENRNFDFSAMCAEGTLGAWGENTCRPSLNKSEYRKYLDFITKKAIDLGVTDFTFGQVYYQDVAWKSNPQIGGVIKDMRDYAEQRGKKIVVGAQTNDIDDEEYLRQFDYITGGIGQDSEGNIEDGECWSTYWERGGYNFCWAMMWNERFKSKANNVLVYLDWNNASNDDMNRFVRMSREKRHKFLAKSYNYFLSQNIGFLMPMLAVLDGSGRGCYGNSPVFYSSSNNFLCKDENAINTILASDAELDNLSSWDNAKFLEVEVPIEMLAQKKYQVKVKVKNSSIKSWNFTDGYKLGSSNPQDTFRWQINRVSLEEEEEILPGATKEFVFDVIAPKETGEYDFQWRMLKEGVHWFGAYSDNIKVRVVDNPNPPSHAIDGPVCKNKELYKCNKWCSEPGAWCDVQTETAYCAGTWFDDKSYREVVDCCVDEDCPGTGSCVNNQCR